MCATPTFVTTTTSGRAIPDRSFTSPRRRAPISATRTCVSGGAPSSVRGSPISLLNDPGLAWTRKRDRATASVEVLGGGLPVRPRDPDDRGIHRRPLVRGEPQQRLRRRAHVHERTHRAHGCRPRAHPRSRRRHRPRTPRPRIGGRRCVRPAGRRRRPRPPRLASPWRPIGPRRRRPPASPRPRERSPTAVAVSCGSADRIELFADHDAVVERQERAPHLLHRLVTPAGHHHDVAGRAARSASRIAARRSGSTT